jgi:preprotein translocase subunit SecE
MAINNPVEFFKQVRQETAKVTWPSRRETMITTGLVFAMVVVAAIFFWVVDWGLSHAVRLVLGIGG